METTNKVIVMQLRMDYERPPVGPVPSRRGRHLKVDNSKAGRYSRSYRSQGWGHQ